MSRLYSKSSSNHQSKKRPSSHVQSDTDSANPSLEPTHSAEQVLHMQRMFGNQATRNMLDSNSTASVTVQRKPAIPKISQSMPQTSLQRYMWSAAEFKRRISMNSSKALPKILAELEKLEQLGNTDIEKRRALLKGLEKDATDWINDHTSGLMEMIDSNSHRKVEMQRFREGVEEEYLKSLALTYEKTGESVDKIEKRDIEAQSVTSALQKFAPIIDTVLATDDMDKSSENSTTELDPLQATGEIDIKVDIPIQPGIKIGAEFHLDAERDSDHGKVGARATVSAVLGGNLADTLVAELRAKFGIYTEAQGSDISEALKLISYAFYRRCRESSIIPSGYTDYMWGGAEGSGVAAENWASEVEAQSFENEDNYVETGGTAGFSSQLKAGSAFDGNIEAGYNSGRRYTKQSIEDAKKSGAKKRGLDFGSAYAKGSMTVFGKGAEVFVKKTWNQTGVHEELEPGVEAKAKLIGIDIKDMFPDLPDMPDLPSLPDFPTLPDFLDLPDFPNVWEAFKKMLPTMPDLWKYLPTLQIKFPDINFLDLPNLGLPDLKVPEEIKELIRQAQTMAQEVKDKMAEAVEKAKTSEQEVAKLMIFTKTVYQQADEKDDKHKNADQKRKSAKIGNKIDALSKAPGVGTALSALGISNPVESTYNLSLDYRVKPELSEDNTLELPFAEMVVEEQNDVNIGAIPFMSVKAKRNKQWMKIRADKGGWKAI